MPDGVHGKNEDGNVGDDVESGKGYKKLREIDTVAVCQSLLPDEACWSALDAGHDHVRGPPEDDKGKDPMQSETKVAAGEDPAVEEENGSFDEEDAHVIEDFECELNLDRLMSVSVLSGPLRALNGQSHHTLRKLITLIIPAATVCFP